MSRTRQMLCIFYAAVALIALVATWSQNLQYSGGDPMHYLIDLKANPASRSFTVDIGLFLLSAAALMVIEARKLGVKFVWLYVIFGFIIAISVTFPLFLIAREMRLNKAGGAGVGVDLTVTDFLGLAITTGVVLAFGGFILT
jgi:Terpene cyclase DEP1